MYFFSTLLLTAATAYAKAIQYGLNTNDCTQVYTPPDYIYPGDTVDTPDVFATFYRTSDGYCTLDFQPDTYSVCRHWAYFIDVTTQTDEGPKTMEVGQTLILAGSNVNGQRKIYCDGNYYMSYTVQGSL